MEDKEIINGFLNNPPNPPLERGCRGDEHGSTGSPCSHSKRPELVEGSKDARFRDRGQTIIETVLVLTLLFIVLFVIVEFSRAWYLKNSLNNAVRVGARFAAVEADIETELAGVEKAGTENCAGEEGNDKVFCEVFASPGVPDGTFAYLIVNTNEGATNDLDAGDIIVVIANSTFETIVPGLLSGFISESMVVSTDATMRFELDL
jgi:hypothetical protein